MEQQRVPTQTKEDVDHPPREAADAELAFAEQPKAVDESQEAPDAEEHQEDEVAEHRAERQDQDVVGEDDKGDARKYEERGRREHLVTLLIGPAFPGGRSIIGVEPDDAEDEVGDEDDEEGAVESVPEVGEICEVRLHLVSVAPDASTLADVQTRHPG